MLVSDNLDLVVTTLLKSPAIKNEQAKFVEMLGFSECNFVSDGVTKWGEKFREDGTILTLASLLKIKGFRKASDELKEVNAMLITKPISNLSKSKLTPTPNQKDIEEKCVQPVSLQKAPEHFETLKIEEFVEQESNGNYEEALKKFMNIWETKKRLLGKENISTILTAEHVACIFSFLSRDREAHYWYQRVLNLRKKVQGINHKDTTGTKFRLADILNDQGKLLEALTMFKEVRASQQIEGGAEAPETLITRCKIASIYYKQGNFSNAKLEYLQVLAIREKKLGKEDKLTLKTKYQLALALYGSKMSYEIYEAKEMMKNVEEAQKRTLGPIHPDTLLTKLEIDKWVNPPANSVERLRGYTTASSSISFGGGSSFGFDSYMDWD